MKVPLFSENEFVDAAGVGGLNAAFGTVSGSVASIGMGVWAAPGLLSPESMGLTFAGMVGSATLPSPWAIVTTGGISVHAHGTQTGQDTNAYSVNFASLVPGSGTVTAFLAATITQIQQNPFPLTGPPQGHPSFNPNFVPSVAYATTVYSVALSAVTGGIDNTSTFELARTTLTAGQVTVSGYSTLGWQRAALFSPRPAGVLASGGALTLAQAPLTILSGVSGLTSTLPSAASGGGLSYQLVNPSASTVWTVAAAGTNTIAGGTGTPVASMGIPPYGAVSLWGNAASGVWEISAVNPLMLASLANVFTAPQTINYSLGTALTISGSGAGGAALTLTGNGATTPSKTLRVLNGAFNIVNNAGATNLLTLDDVGNATVAAQIAAASMQISGSGSIGNGLAVGSGGVRIGQTDSGGMQLRTSVGTNPGAGFRNDGAGFYIMLSANGAPLGSFNGLRPLTVNLLTGGLTLDATGAGVIFGGPATIPNVVASIGTVGGVTFPGGGAIVAAGAINSSSSISGASLVSAGNVTANGGRLRAAVGALNSGDTNAATILNDFTFQTFGGQYISQKIPNNQGSSVMQAYIGTSITGEDVITFPNAFANTCIEVIAGEANPGGGWVANGAVTVFGTELLSPTQFTLFVFKWLNGSWQPAPGVGYRYIAHGW